MQISYDFTSTISKSVQIILFSSFPYNFHNFSVTPHFSHVISWIWWRIHSYPTPQQPITTSQRIPLIPQQFEVVALKPLDSNSLVTDVPMMSPLWSFVVVVFVGRRKCGGKHMGKKTMEKCQHTARNESSAIYLSNKNTTNISLVSQHLQHLQKGQKVSQNQNGSINCKPMDLAKL